MNMERQRDFSDLRQAAEADPAATGLDLVERTAELTRAHEARVALLRRLVTAQEDERRRVSRELHDGLGQELTALILGLKALEVAVLLCRTVTAWPSQTVKLPAWPALAQVTRAATRVSNV